MAAVVGGEASPAPRVETGKRFSSEYEYRVTKMDGFSPDAHRRPKGFRRRAWDRVARVLSSGRLKKMGNTSGHGKVLSKSSALAEVSQSRRLKEATKEGAPTESAMCRFSGTWHAIKVEGRDDFLKSMSLPWILRKIAATMPPPDMLFFIHDDTFLHSHTVMFGKVVDEQYKEGGSSSKSRFGVTTTLTYHWEGDSLTYTLTKSGSPEEETKSRRWIEPDGTTMVAETHFRKTAAAPWVILRRTYVRVSAEQKSGAAPPVPDGDEEPKKRPSIRDSRGDDGGFDPERKRTESV